MNLNYAEKLDKLVDIMANSPNNFLLHGPGGVGKSWLISKLIERYSTKLKIGLTAMTGVAAINISGCTFHQWSGINATESEITLINRLNRKGGARRWRSCDLLIIDEISMMGEDLFTRADSIARHIRKSDKPWGGLRCIFVGDFLQLPPVKAKWVFTSNAWNAMNLKYISLTKSMRFDNDEFNGILNRIRTASYTYADMEKLMTRYKATFKSDKIIPTILHAKRIDVDAYNKKCVDELSGAEHKYVANDYSTRCRNMDYNRIFSDVPPVIVLKEGAQVMLRTNHDVEEGFVNGSRGIVVNCTHDCVYVQFKQGILGVEQKTWQVQIDNVIYTRKQMPLIVAYAVTIHKTQGCTLDAVQCDLSDIFEPGQAYVALSRVRNLESLVITNISSNSIVANQEVLTYLKTLQAPPASNSAKN